MPVEFTLEKFKRVGRKTEGEETLEYEARQIKEDSFPKDSAEDVWEAILEVSGGDPSKAASYFVSGANHHLRLEAGGYTPEEKAAKALMKSGLLPNLDFNQVLEIVKGMKRS